MVYYFNIFDEYITNNISTIRSAVVQYDIFAENSLTHFEFEKSLL